MSPVDLVQKHVLAAIRGPAAILPGAPVMVAVSGGADSVCLLHVLWTLAPRFDWSLHIAHVHHGLRGAQADADENFVRSLCQRWSLPFYVERVDVAAQAAAARESVETTGRRVRYRFFDTLARHIDTRCDAVDPRSGAPIQTVIAVAHHREDQAETVLLHLFRGSGLTGLAGMSPRNGRIVRPLLTVPRQEILRYLAAVDLSFRADASNESSGYTRNRVRLDLIPRIEQATASGLTARLAATADLLRDDVVYLEQAARDQMAAIRRGPGVDGAELHRLPRALSSRIVRLLYAAQVGHCQDLERKHTAAILALLASTRRAGLDLPGGMRAVYDAGVLAIKPRRPVPDEVSAWEPVRLRLTGETWTPAGRFIALASPAEAHTLGDTAQLFQVGLRAQWAQAVVRTRKPGDRIRPAGGVGSRLLKRFFIDRRIPVHVRDHLPLIAVGNQVVWLPGIAQAAERAAATSSGATWTGADASCTMLWLAYEPTAAAAAAIRVAVAREM